MRLAFLTLALAIKNIQGQVFQSSLRSNITYSKKGFNTASVISDWITCNPSTDTCASAGAVCCIANADRSSGKHTCRPSASDCWGSSVPNYASCSQTAGYCSSNNYLCCVAPADVSTKKTTCRPTNDCNGLPSPVVKPTVASPTSSTFQSGVLNVQNGARASIGVPALTWSTSLANVAQNWVNKCSYKHEPSSPYGNNLAANSGQPLTGVDCAQGWVNEKANYIGGPISSSGSQCKNSNFGSCGHYTQVVWRASTNVGCAVQSCTVNSPFGSFNGGKWNYCACYYSPAGNVIGQKPY